MSKHISFCQCASFLTRGAPIRIFEADHRKQYLPIPIFLRPYLRPIADSCDRIFLFEGWMEAFLIPFFKNILFYLFDHPVHFCFYNRAVVAEKLTQHKPDFTQECTTDPSV